MPPKRADIVASRLPTLPAIIANVRWGAITDEDERRRIAEEVLAAAEEYGGVTLPRHALQLNPGMTTKGFPSGPPALTTKGLQAFYARRGWRFFLFHVDILLAAFRGQNERIQEVLALYEAECAARGVATIPAWADGPFVAGGEGDLSPFAAMVSEQEQAGE